MEQEKKKDKKKRINQEEYEKLLSEIQTLQEEKIKMHDDYLLALADLENTKKRLTNEADNTRKYRIQSFAIEILPVIDNLERALSQEVSEDQVQFKKGVEMIKDQLVNALKNEGVEEIDCLNKPFDANFHQAIMTEKKDGVEPGVVIEVLQKGYVLKDRILRASMVKVSE